MISKPLHKLIEERCIDIANPDSRSKPPKESLEGSRIVSVRGLAIPAVIADCSGMRMLERRAVDQKVFVAVICRGDAVERLVPASVVCECIKTHFSCFFCSLVLVMKDGI